MIFLEDGWPIFYKQVRTGHHGSEFEVIKFRTMKNDCEKDDSLGLGRLAANFLCFEDDKVMCDVIQKSATGRHLVSVGG